MHEYDPDQSLLSSWRPFILYANRNSALPEIWKSRIFLCALNRAVCPGIRHSSCDFSFSNSHFGLRNDAPQDYGTGPVYRENWHLDLASQSFFRGRALFTGNGGDLWGELRGHFSPMSTFCPVRGWRPVGGFARIASRMPNPTSVTLSPCTTAPRKVRMIPLILVVGRPCSAAMVSSLSMASVPGG